MQDCPCGSGASLAVCCGPVIAGNPAPTAEALMRSRYTAYALRDLDHIERTQAAGRDDFDRAAAETAARAVEWTGLEILGGSGGGTADDTGTVEFAAHYRKDGRLHLLCEVSSFRREQGRWVYVDGLVSRAGEPPRYPKVGRNAPCPCGSGKKYKKCCGA
ncbi:MAG TPA: YchJ family protein [Thalassobaculum sp.]